MTLLDIQTGIATNKEEAIALFTGYWFIMQPGEDVDPDEIQLIGWKLWIT